MASIIKRKHKTCTSYRVQIRRVGLPFLSISFSTKEEAEQWVKENEKAYCEGEKIEIDRLKEKRKREFKTK